jgi:hypothetical protein
MSMYSSVFMYYMLTPAIYVEFNKASLRGSLQGNTFLTASTTQRMNQTVRDYRADCYFPVIFYFLKTLQNPSKSTYPYPGILSNKMFRKSNVSHYFITISYRIIRWSYLSNFRNQPLSELTNQCNLLLINLKKPNISRPPHGWPSLGWDSSARYSMSALLLSSVS